MQTIAEQLGKRDLATFRSHPSIVSTCALGVELELEGFTDRDVDLANRHLHPRWVSHRDGSLRNGGIEFVTHGGLGGQELHTAYETLVHCLEHDVNYDASWRCSTHMHVNMLDCTMPQVVKFLLAYTAAEPILFEHNGAYRRSSNFCTPVGDSMAFHKKLIGRLTPDSIQTRWGAQACNKYTALNLQPLFGDGRNCPALGTVEFRGGRPMTTLADLLTQTNILLSIKEFAKNHEGEVEDFMTQLNDGVFARIFHNGVAEQYRSVPVEVLEEAVVNAWVLHKSYVRGLASYEENIRQEQQRLASGNPFEMAVMPQAWANLGIRSEGTLPQATPPEFFNVARSGPMCPAEGEMPSHWMTEQECLIYSKVVEKWTVLTNQGGVYTKKRQTIAAYSALTQRQPWGSLTGVQAGAILVNWILSCDSEQSVFGTVIRCLRWFSNHSVPRNYREAPVVSAVGRDGTPAAMSARNLAAGISMDYRVQLGNNNFETVCANFGISTHTTNNRKIALHFQKSTVRVRNRDLLRHRLSEATGVSLSHCILPEEMPVTELYFALRWAGVASADHVSNMDLAKYDRIVMNMAIAEATGAMYPVHVQFWQMVKSVMYITSMDDHLGLHSAPDTRTARLSPTTLVEVH